jgi:hypothetical protein
MSLFEPEADKGQRDNPGDFDEEGPSGLYYTFLIKGTKDM